MATQQFRPFTQLVDTKPIRCTAWHPSGEVYAVGTNSSKIKICAYPDEEELDVFYRKHLQQQSFYNKSTKNDISSSRYATPQADNSSNGHKPSQKQQENDDGQSQYASSDEVENSGNGEEREDELPQPKILYKFLRIHQGSVYCLAFNSSGRLMASGSNDHVVHVVPYNQNKHLPEGAEFMLTMHNGTVRNLMFMRNSCSDNATSDSTPLLVSAGAGEMNEIFVSDCEAMKPTTCFTGHDEQVMALSQWGEPTAFASASLDGTIRFWDMRDKRCSFKVMASKLSNSINININTALQSLPKTPPVIKPFGTNISGGGDGDDGCGATATTKSASQICSMTVGGNGQLLVAGFGDGRCMLYDVRSRSPIQVFQAHDGELRALSISPKSYYLLTGGFDGNLMLTDLQGDLTGRLPSVCIAELDDKVVSGAWHPHYNETFVTTSANKTATLWTLDAAGSSRNKHMLDFSLLSTGAGLGSPLTCQAPTYSTPAQGYRKYFA